MHTSPKPATPPISVRMQRLGPVAVVHLSGELDLATVDHVERELGDVADGVDGLVVDLEGLSFLASTGLALLARWHGRAGEQGFAFRVVAANRQVLRPIQLTALDDVLALDATVDEALVAIPRQVNR
ncbi:STAS domain-containing protein [Kutzneria buriramensis]|nr:STAS domain-containing protein [Kutzneria buriramensis]